MRSLMIQHMFLFSGLWYKNKRKSCGYLHYLRQNDCQHFRIPQGEMRPIVKVNWIKLVKTEDNEISDLFFSRVTQPHFVHLLDSTV